MCEGSDHPPELLVSQDIRSCRNCPRNCGNPPRGIITKTSPREYTVLQSVNRTGRNVRARGHRKVWVGFGLFNIKIALLIEGQSGWATGIRGTQILRGVPAGGAGVVAVESTGEIPGHEGGQTRNGTVKASVTGSASASGNNRGRGREGNH